jgi:hypothetical protein
MGELLYKIKELAKCRMFNLHGNMLRVKDDAMLVVINIRAVLKSPGAAIDRNGDYAVVLAGRMIDPSGITFILPAKKALGIA